MTIIDKIRASIQRVHGSAFPVKYHDELDLNVLADGTTYPAAFVTLITRGTLVSASGQLKEEVTAVVYFVEPMQGFDFDADANEIVLDRCKKRALRWLLGLPLDPDIELRSVEYTQRAYEQYDAILTGYGVVVRLRELKGVTDCPEGAGDFNADFNADFLIAI